MLFLQKRKIQKVEIDLGNRSNFQVCGRTLRWSNGGVNDIFKAFTAIFQKVSCTFCAWEQKQKRLSSFLWACLKIQLSEWMHFSHLRAKTGSHFVMSIRKLCCWIETPPLPPLPKCTSTHFFSCKAKSNLICKLRRRRKRVRLELANSFHGD